MNKKIILIVGYLILAIAVSSCQKGAEMREDNYSLFSTLDPVLGYAHNENYHLKSEDKKKFNIHFNDEAYVHLKNGFVKMEYKTNEHPVKITILGSSSTDPYLFDGNWPLAFHNLLVEKNIPHIIYNGAVSGYNSSQALFKLVRDVFSLDQQDLVIFYHGGNDFIENEDILKSHPVIHPYIKKIMEQIYVTSTVDMSYWEKFTVGLLKKKSTLQLGVPNEKYADNFINNVNYMKLIANSRNAKFVHVLEGYLENSSQYAVDNPRVEKNEKFDKRVAIYLKGIRDQMESFDYSITIQDEIPLNKTIFYDSVHLNLEGNKIIAQAIFKKLNDKKYLEKGFKN